MDGEARMSMTSSEARTSLGPLNIPSNVLPQIYKHIIKINYLTLI